MVDGMVEILEHLISQCALHPDHERARLYAEMMRSELFVLALGKAGSAKRQDEPRGDFSLWADGDGKDGGVWALVFPSRERAQEYADARGLVAPKGREYFWMGYKPPYLFSMLGRSQNLAGARLYLDERASVRIAREVLSELSEGRVPADGA